MVELVWVDRSPLDGAVAAGLHRAGAAIPRVSVAEIRDFSLIQVIARRGRAADMADAMKVHFGATVPAEPSAVQTHDAVLLWSGPDQFLLLSQARNTFTIENLRSVLSDSASLADQSHARALLRISGPKARDMLAKLTSIDLHPAVFPIGAASATALDHTNVNLWRSANKADGIPVFNLLILATFAESLWKTLLDAAVEYGIDVRHEDLRE